MHLWAAASLLLAVAAALWHLPVAARGLSPSERHAMSFALDLLPPAVAPPVVQIQSHAREPRPLPDAIVDEPPLPPSEPDVFLVIGVKTRVLRGVDARRAIRDTWAAPAATKSLGVRVVFLGCAPDLSILTDADKINARTAIANEKAVFQDLWTDELECVDSFFTLVDKTVAFLDRALATWPTLQYAMVADDDVYVRLDRLVTLLQSDRIPETRFYGGNVAEKKQLRSTAPIRNPESRYYLPLDLYPMRDLPPFVAGAQYLLSGDIVAFVARNRRDLRGLRGLDDATVAVWMLALQIRPTMLLDFQILRSFNCTETLVSYADLAPTAMRTAHANLVNDRPFCTGFEHTQWFKEYTTVNFDDLDADDDDDDDDSGDVRFDWDLEIDAASARLQIHTKITIANQTIGLTYFPGATTYSIGFCNRILPMLEAKLSILVGTNFCRLHRKILLKFLKNHDTSAPPLRPLLTLARHNLERDAVDDAAKRDKSVLHVRVLAPHANRSVFILIECLLVAAYPDQHVVVLSESDTLDRSGVPDVVVVVPATNTDISELLRKFPDPKTKLLVLTTDTTPVSIPSTDQRVVVISADLTAAHARALYLPQASVVLASAIRRSPLNLLVPVDAVSNPHESFAAVWSRRCDDGSLGAIGTLLAKVAIDQCWDATTFRESLTPVDDMIDALRRYKFVIVQDSALDEGIAMALLAGSIPIYLGGSDTVTGLFIAKAFIDCRNFASPTECLDAVLALDHSAERYQVMKNEPPIVNKTAFIEAFSWHPQVATMATPNDKVILVGSCLQQLLRDS